jgi:hypothetical protein
VCFLNYLAFLWPAARLLSQLSIEAQPRLYLKLFGAKSASTDAPYKRSNLQETIASKHESSWLRRFHAGNAARNE